MNNYTVKSNVNIAKDVYKMILEGDVSKITSPGQFINITIDGLYLRRPISVCDIGENTITIIYKVVGEGTAKMSGMKEGTVLDCLTGLGNGFGTQIKPDSNKPLLIGGGVGTPPLYMLAKKLLKEGKQPKVILGFASKDDCFYEEEYKALGLEVEVMTADSSYGGKGFVTNAKLFTDKDYDYIYTCGPIPMLKAIYDNSEVSGQFSFEERMGCGFGACMGCSCKTKYGNKRICKDGPVLVKEEIIW